MSQLASDLVLSINRRRMLGGLAAGLGGAVLAACGGRADAQVAAACQPPPIPGPRAPSPPMEAAADGRSTSSRWTAWSGATSAAASGGMEAVPRGVPLELEIALVGAGAPAAHGPAGRLSWRNDAAGEYSALFAGRSELSARAATRRRTGPRALHHDRPWLLRRAPIRIAISRRSKASRRRWAERPSPGLPARLPRCRMPCDLPRRCPLWRRPGQSRPPADRPRLRVRRFRRGRAGTADDGAGQAIEPQDIAGLRP